MADIALKLNYASKMRAAILQSLRLTMPLWALFLPVLYIGSIIFGHNSFYKPGVEPLLFWELVNATAVFGVPLFLLLIIRGLERSNLLIDKNGIELPAELPGTGV